MILLVLIIDGMGGGIGTQLVSQLSGQSLPGVEIICVGTNSWATQSMLKAGAVRGATGENAVRVMAGHADVIAGPIGIVMTNALMGEITAAMAEAVTSSAARKILVPVNQGHFEIVGMESRPLLSLIKEAAACIADIAVSRKG